MERRIILGERCKGCGNNHIHIMVLTGRPIIGLIVLYVVVVMTCWRIHLKSPTKIQGDQSVMLSWIYWFFHETTLTNERVI